MCSARVGSEANSEHNRHTGTDRATQTATNKHPKAHQTDGPPTTTVNEASKPASKHCGVGQVAPPTCRPQQAYKQGTTRRTACAHMHRTNWAPRSRRGPDVLLSTRIIRQAAATAEHITATLAAVLHTQHALKPSAGTGWCHVSTPARASPHSSRHRARLGMTSAHAHNAQRGHLSRHAWPS